MASVPLIDYFVAADDASAAAVLDTTGGPQVAGLETLPAKGIDPSVALGGLESILTGHEYAQVTGDPRHCHPLTDTESDAIVVTVSDTLRDALATADDERLAGVAREWAQTEELADVDADLVGEVVGLFATLARHATANDARLYCWWVL